MSIEDVERLDRRVQLLLDADRKARVEQEAERTGKSVNAVIRAAIDVAYPSASSKRIEAAEQFLAHARRHPSTMQETWTEMKDIYEDSMVKMP